MRSTILLAAALLVCTGPSNVGAQQLVTRFDRTNVRFAADRSLQREQERGEAVAFVIEAAGGAAASFAAFSVMAAALEECDVDDLACDISSVAASVGVATIASAGGAYLAGSLARTGPSALGAAIGSLVGAAAGVGAWHFIKEEIDIGTSDAGAIAIYAVTQGVVTALGSRIVRALKRQA